MSALLTPLGIAATLVLVVGAPAASGSAPATFPGVSRDLASFCSARPSLSVDLAPMIVHVKRDTSFNYKLYLFSSDYVFQTGQIVPRDDFRVHSFPVKFKRLNEFWPQAGVPTYQYKYQNSSADSLVRAPGGGPFDARRFLALVPLRPGPGARRRAPSGAARTKGKRVQAAGEPLRRGWRARATTAGAHQEGVADTGGSGLPLDAQPHVLAGDDDSLAGRHGAASPTSAGLAGYRALRAPRASRAPVAAGDDDNVNKHIQFDRDDQVAVLAADDKAPRRDALSGPGGDQETSTNSYSKASQHQENEFARQMIMPVGSFSSFHVNLTYLARKDFDQTEPELIKIQLDANRFVIDELHLIATSANKTQQNFSFYNYPQHEDYAFLAHKLLRDPNTRITSISQIYEHWITRNFYTIVYVQRRIGQVEPVGANDAPSDYGEPIESIVTDRLIFRGSSMVLLGAEQLDYDVKASAFITEKNGLHYYLEFLTNGKFYLCAIDWTKRPFKIIDSRRLPMKATKTQFDNEELLLCPPAICYSEQPIDEIVNYGRITLSKEHQHTASVLSGSRLANFSQHHTLLSSSLPPTFRDESDGELIYGSTSGPGGGDHRLKLGLSRMQTGSTRLHADDQPTAPTTPINSQLDDLSDAIKSGSSQLEVRLHLRDWVWTLARAHERQQIEHEANLMTANSATPTSELFKNESKFVYRFEWARRNDIKVNPDTYGFVLAGHEIDASYRVFNELYLITANHLITINYTVPNETVTSTQPIGDEFSGLSSTLLSPITGAYYDRYANQVYFFKGDRYVGYDYATKKPLEDFQLARLAQFDDFAPATSQQTMTTASGPQRPAPLVSSLPVVGILGRQHHVDAIYHDFSNDIVYIFTGMKFYTLLASDFKDGAFRPIRQPVMRCISEHFLAGCRFDAAYPSPCRSELEVEGSHGTQTHPSERLVAGGAGHGPAEQDNRAPGPSEPEDEAWGAHKDRRPDFSQEQQMKLRSIAARGGLLDLLVENGLLAGRPLAGPMAAPAASQERIVIYLLMAMVAVTILATVAMFVVIINWTKARTSPGQGQPVTGGHQAPRPGSGLAWAEGPRPVEPSEFRATQFAHHYLANQQHHLRRHQRHSVGRRQPLGATDQLPPGTLVSIPKSAAGQRLNKIDSSAL